jgi:GNAT superfamily N-acetyltransferase
MGRTRCSRSTAVRITEASLRDINEVCRLRIAMLDGFRLRSASERRSMLAALRVYFRTMMKRKEVQVWFLKVGAETVATAAIVVFHRPPRAVRKMKGEAYLFSCYTVPQHRRKGYATRLLRHIVAEARASGFSRVWLRASEEGEKVYRKAGFRHPTNVMELDLA